MADASSIGLALLRASDPPKLTINPLLPPKKKTPTRPLLTVHFREMLNKED